MPDLGPYTPFLYLAIVGLIAGWLSGLLLGGGGLIRNLIVGLMGAYVGGFLVQMLKLNIGLGSAFVDQIAVATIGAIFVTIVARVIAR
jgi:uncharacterized membrane protein YeaQ/YmgE (transglycosylase-associated protein family)